jgi:hypothetical protein
MAIDGVRIADDGTISFRGDERIGAEHLFGTTAPSPPSPWPTPYVATNRDTCVLLFDVCAGVKYPGDTCTLTVLRRGQSINVETVLRVR